MVHVYQFDTIKGAKNRKVLSDVFIPLWFIEGMAEYYSVEWDFSSEEILRDIVINNRIVPLDRLSDLNSLRPDEYYLVYKQGQAFLKFIGDNYGKTSIYKIFKGYLNGDKDPYKTELGSSLVDIEKTFVFSLRKKYLPKLVSSDKSLFSTIFDFRKYFMITVIDTLAFRFVGGYKFGLDANSFPFYVGGVGTLRGYDFKEFSGKLIFLSNLELRIALIRALLGPFGFSFPPVFGSLFVDAALVGDDITKFQLTRFDENEGVYKLKDLKVGVGVGVGIALGVGFKLRFDFASPFDGRKLLDAKDWKTYFQLGYEF